MDWSDEQLRILSVKYSNRRKIVGKEEFRLKYPLRNFVSWPPVLDASTQIDSLSVFLTIQVIRNRILGL